MKRVALLGLLVIIGCGSQIKNDDEVDPRVHKGIDAKLIQYVDSFEKEVGISVDDIPINVGYVPYQSVSNFKDNKIGVCLQWTDGGTKILFSEILINPDYFATFDDDMYHIEMEILMWHELAHCTINKKHNNKTLMNDGSICNEKDGSSMCNEGKPLSIMRWYTFSPVEIMSFYIPEKQQYIDELKAK